MLVRDHLVGRRQPNHQNEHEHDAADDEYEHREVTARYRFPIGQRAHDSREAGEEHDDKHHERRAQAAEPDVTMVHMLTLRLAERRSLLAGRRSRNADRRKSRLRLRARLRRQRHAGQGLDAGLIARLRADRHAGLGLRAGHRLKRHARLGLRRDGLGLGRHAGLTELAGLVLLMRIRHHTSSWAKRASSAARSRSCSASSMPRPGISCSPAAVATVTLDRPNARKTGPCRVSVF